MVGWKFTKFLMSCLKPQVNFSLNFTSFFSVMRNNSSVVFYLKLYMIWTKGAHQSEKFQTFVTWKSKNWDFDGILLSKVEIYELKIYRGVICHDSEEWCKIWGRIDLSVQNWHEEFDEFWLEDSKISKICTLMGCLIDQSV